MAELRLRIDLAGGGAIGPGKIALLEAVDEAGSIAGAARRLDMSYRRAWLLVDGLNRLFAETVVERRPGGRAGGGASLTPFGRALVDRFRRIERRAQAAAADDLRALDRSATEGVEAPPRRLSRPG
jgi:molybdate transport system regulatory protein